MRESHSILVIWNPNAGSTLQNIAVREHLEKQPGVDLRETTSIEEAKHLAATASDSYSLVVACGGDGSVNTIAQALLRRKKPIPMTVMPLGTGNDYARTLAIPLDPWLAVERLTPDRLAQGQIRMLDVIEVRSQGEVHRYINMATAGNTGVVLDVLTDDMKQFWGPLCYLRGAVSVLSDLTVYKVTLTADDRPPETYEALNLILANGRTSGGGLQAAPHASLEDGKLEMLLVKDGTPADIAGLAAKYVLSDYIEHDMIVYRRVSRLKVQSLPSLPVTADGNIITRENFELEVLPGVLPVYVGEDYLPEPEVV